MCPMSSLTACRRDTTQCVANFLVCNGVYDCPDKSDEEFCNRKTVYIFTYIIIIVSVPNKDPPKKGQGTLPNIHFLVQRKANLSTKAKGLAVWRFHFL